LGPDLTIQPSIACHLSGLRAANGLSHCKEENTREPDLEVKIDAVLRLVDKTVAAIATDQIRPGLPSPL
jgi:hypothetical protein